MTLTVTVSAFYKFVSLPEFERLRPLLLERLSALDVRGSVLLASEGINGTIAGASDKLAEAMEFIRGLPPFAALESKESAAHRMPFGKLKVRLKKEIVTMGVPGIDPNRNAGLYVDPQDWNALISDPEVLVIDTRNHFEVEFGTFAGAIDPHTRHFKEFPGYVRSELAHQKDRRIAMFCTGGIRCEKATAYLMKSGFSHVHHLKGGILRYLETVPREQSLWRGECFVFDERVALGQGLKLRDPEAPE